MGPRHGLAGTALAVLLAIVPADRARADVYCQERERPLASVLVIHGGAWMGGSAADGRDVCSPLAAMGYRVRSLEYPLWTIPGSIRYAYEAAREEAARGRPVYATGISAGGTIAEFLAVKSQIDGAVAVAPLSDFVNWRPPTPGFWAKLGMTPEMRYRLSPSNNIEAPAPLRIIHSPQDRMVPYEQSVRMVSRCAEVCELVTLRLGLGHISLGARGSVLQWFADTARNPRFASRPATPPPMVLRAGLTPRSFAVGSTSTRDRPGRTPRRLAVLSYTLSAPGHVRVMIERRLRPRSRRRCRVSATRQGRTRLCPARSRVGMLALQGVAGTNRVNFPGKLDATAFKPGAYRASLTAAARPGGPSSKPRHVEFRVRASRR